MRTILLVAVAAVGMGCAARRWEARATQPNPIKDLKNPDELPVSDRLYIYQRDMSLPRDFQMRSWAQFSVVTRDRVRFHVGIARRYESEADTHGWKVYVEDETGKQFQPEREVARVNRLALNWRLWPYRPGDSWCQRPPCVSREVPGYEAYEGMADYSIHEPEVLATRKQLSLVLRRGSQEMRFTWRFGDEHVIEHYGRSKTDDELGTIEVPGPYTELAGSRVEDESW
jgi:hypothetical protein